MVRVRARKASVRGVGDMNVAILAAWLVLLAVVVAFPRRPPPGPPAVPAARRPQSTGAVKAPVPTRAVYGPQRAPHHSRPRSRSERRCRLSRA